MHLQWWTAIICDKIIITAHRVADQALNSFNGRLMYGQEVHLNWATRRKEQSSSSADYHIFVGDLAPDVTDTMLFAAFSTIPGCNEARVVWNQASCRCGNNPAHLHVFLLFNLCASRKVGHDALLWNFSALLET